ncbi:uncharacterized protein LOC105219262 isoform X3 [Zeugodacus cucurbitae]|uniref:uncharacterized protein LOC105219262 isoform X3 n=1 Tax=Zeugodacus cucurbitae TaxID=28588 RepID=UPI0023D95F88|nr:uncharacterized protein LOC105219262 isoform X3 [Zeugodacus cucurbitae]
MENFRILLHIFTEFDMDYCLRKGKTWTVVETNGLLKCYLARREEFLHQRKKRNAYAHVLEDKLPQGFT